MPLDAPEGLCPACLAKVALDSELAVTGAGPASLGTVRYFGDYELLEEIARGGMGVVYKARQVSLNRIVAVKMILAGQLAGEAEVKRFRTEAEAAAQLQHPNIVAIHEVGEHEGQYYFSMDFIAGTSLAARLGSEPLPIGEAVRWMKTIAEAVHFAHERGIVHRDLKPANVLLDEFDEPRVTDFGVAKRLEKDENITATGALLGTPDYMSPEQAAGRQDIVGPAGDVFSLGVMLYQMLTGRVPFRGANLGETLAHILQKEAVPPSRLNPRVPPDLERICLKCLEKRPDRRYRTAEAFAQDLGRFLNHEAISARTPSTSRKASRWLENHPQFLAALGSAVLIALVWLGYGLWSENRLLTWEKDHPTELKPASDWSTDEQSWWAVTVPLMFLVTGLQDLLAKRTRKRVLTGRFVSPHMLSALALAGLAGIALSVYIGAAGIESWRWANHALPLARAQLAAETAAKEKIEQLRIPEASSLEASQQLTKEIYELQKQLTNGSGALNPAIVQQLDLKLRQQGPVMAAIVSNLGASAAVLLAQNSNVLARVSNPNQLDFKIVQKTASATGLGFLLFVNAFSVWLCAGLTLKAFREHRFNFYVSAQEEQSALSQALLDQEQTQAREQARRLSTIRFIIVPVSLLLLLFPLLDWGQNQELSANLVAMFGDAGGYLVALIACLQSWRSAERRHTLNRVLLVLSTLVVVAALLHGPASLVGPEIGFGIVSGAALGLFISWTRKTKVL